MIQKDNKSFDIKNMDGNQSLIVVGAIIFIVSIAEILLINSGIGLVALLFTYIVFLLLPFPYTTSHESSATIVSFILPSAKDIQRFETIRHKVKSTDNNLLI